MGRHKKITWDVIFRDYKSHYPKGCKDVLHFQPYAFATILLIFQGGERMTYNYDTKNLSAM